MRVRSTVAVVVALLVAAVSAIHARPGVEQILQKAEEIRNPDLDYAVDFTIHGVSHNATIKSSERDASYSMLARGKDRTVILMRVPDGLYGALVMMADSRYWMLLPKASRPWELSTAQITNGDVATGDIARANLTRGYAAKLAGSESLDGETCWRLELQSESAATPYAHVIYWIAKKGFLPRKLEHHGPTGELLKVVRYGDYRKGALGLRSMKLDIESVGEWKESSTLVFQNLRKIELTPTLFTPEGLIPFRDAALSARQAGAGGVATLEKILDTMNSAPASTPAR